MDKESPGTLRLLRVLYDLGEVPLTEAASLAGVSRSWAWKVVRKLEAEGVVKAEKRGGVLIVSPGSNAYRRLLRVGILRASEYPYIIPFKKLLSNVSRNVEVIVYDEAFRLATDLAVGRIHLGMAPAVTHLAVHRLSGGLTGILAGGSSGGTGIVDSGRGEGHASTMTSTMELCAETRRLPLPRVYASSGEEILSLVASGRVRYGVLWEPYLELARRRGLRVESCDLPFCCLLGGHRNLWEEAERIQALFARAVEEARRRLRDPVLVDSYSSLVGLPRELVAATIANYEFLEDPPVSELKRLMDAMRRVVLPPGTLQRAIIR